MPVKFFCNICGKEMWELLPQWERETLTIAQAERSLTCSDCLLEKIREYEKKEESK